MVVALRLSIRHSPFGPPPIAFSETTLSPPALRPSSFALRPSHVALRYNPPNASSPPDPRRWERVRRTLLRLYREPHRRSRLQHLADRLPGDRHRPVLPLPDRHDDLPAHRQLRDREGRRAE